MEFTVYWGRPNEFSIYEYQEIYKAEIRDIIYAKEIDLYETLM